LYRDEFYQHCKVVADILKPIRDAILEVEGRNSNLADCFMTMIKIAVAINNLSINHNISFRNQLFELFNRRYEQFDDDLYLLAYFLHPKYRGKFYYTYTYMYIILYCIIIN
jgi:hypothetical protein